MATVGWVVVCVAAWGPGCSGKTIDSNAVETSESPNGGASGGGSSGSDGWGNGGWGSGGGWGNDGGAAGVYSSYDPIPEDWPTDSDYVGAPLPTELDELCGAQPSAAFDSDSTTWRQMLEGQWLLCPNTAPATSPLPDDVVGLALADGEFTALVLDSNDHVVLASGIDYTGECDCSGYFYLRPVGAFDTTTSAMILGLDPIQLRIEHVGSLVRP